MMQRPPSPMIASARRNRSIHARNIPCPFPGCRQKFRATSGLTQHIQHKHKDHGQSVEIHSSSSESTNPSAVPQSGNDDPSEIRESDSWQDSFRFIPDPEGLESENEDPPMSRDSQQDSGRPCDQSGAFLEPGSPPVTHKTRGSNDWTPFQSAVEFETADFLFRRNQMPQDQIDDLMKLWGATLRKYHDLPPFINHVDMLKKIDSSVLGDVAWKSFDVTYQGERPAHNTPEWMDSDYTVWYRDPYEVVTRLLDNPDFAGEFDYAVYQDFDQDQGRRYKDFMSGDWAWKQCVTGHGSNCDADGATFVPIILGSDKTTVSVATGQNEYYPLYMSIGNIHNNVRRAHRDGVVLIGFLAIAKTDRQYANDNKFRKFRRQLFHSSLSTILQPLPNGMTVPEIMRYPDGHFRCTIFGLGPYIADYPEQALLACIVNNWCPKCTAHPSDLDTPASPRSREQSDDIAENYELGDAWEIYGLVADIVPFTNDFPRADIHELLAPDILHQIIKGSFKDHLVTWVETYLVKAHGQAKANTILADIDRRISAVPPFPGLRRFPQGRGFKQWTGDDSKALMKVYLPAIAGHVPEKMVKAISAFLDFCYLCRRNVHNEKTLQELEDALCRFHEYRVIFQELGVREGFSLHRQHALSHYKSLICLFGAPNGLCSSITESKHIKAVKEPWRRSNHFEAIMQMMVTNQRLDKLSAMRVNFIARGMLADSAPALLNPSRDADDDDDDGEVDGPSVLAYVNLARKPDLGKHIQYQQLPKLVLNFLNDVMNLRTSGSPVTLDDLEGIQSLSTFHSAVSVYYAPSDPCGAGGMHKERIRASPSWRKGHPRYDCAFVQSDTGLEGFAGLQAVRIRLFFSFKFRGVTYPCALVNWFSPVMDFPDPETGMWIVTPVLDNRRRPIVSVIHLNCVVRGAHLIGVTGKKNLPVGFHFSDSLDAFQSFYVNKYADHHAFEIAY
ncbi:hypothetical protein GLOTRDRAFT_101899 [Gloeophyllum trabeum ATCC 11539]|uniref:C2H2-type domain-containing protein n=1 Tax=Gloeophyllum trabeum (strain ATCC 11539 / FP-39264 / Madison 617) TaxID=670483 RepID=S7QL52_GLOTA|nr:uncharacterized protein GLOTRDRAFT_101899 [Gloeophyllum trabeum ATCC 11539]EPQ59998.1 hypothetical protein GLOTRDRAFT_101899 [Gloeophyllum trabeum ATCC 11539]